MKTSFIVILLIVMGMTDAAHKCERRQLNGYICKDCTELVRCIKINDEWEEIPEETCSNRGDYCNAREGACRKHIGPCHPKAKFTCTSDGYFPDPYDCQSYHNCYINGAYIFPIHNKCDLNLAYDPRTGNCTSSLNEDVCQVDGFSCTRAGDMGPWLHNPKFYYVCRVDRGDQVIHYPELRKCGPNEAFVTDRCVKLDVTNIH